MYKTIFSLLAVAVLSACGESQSGTLFPDATIDESFSTNTIRRDDGVVTPYRLGILTDEGTYVVCAAAQNIQGSQGRQVLAALKVTINGDTLQRGLGWARSHPGNTSLDGRPAACRKTTYPVVENAQIGVELTQTTFGRERD
ncbi:hypothetical protein [Yoonia sp. 2307UL14-13]|uniref:hypothetical protein n=1 Tax=Yoonia sp. 2307UL14-13 TaxID=3126506 RepID=UPI00309DD7FE